MTYINESQMESNNPKHTKKHQIQKLATKNSPRNHFSAYMYEIQKPAKQKMTRNNF